jgi:hypothetical protein
MRPGQAGKPVPGLKGKVQRRLFLCFLVLNMLAAGGAVLTQIEAFRIISFIFLGGVIASFAITASHCDDDPVVFFSHDKFSWAVSKRRQKKMAPGGASSCSISKSFKNCQQS